MPIAFTGVKAGPAGMNGVYLVGTDGQVPTASDCEFDSERLSVVVPRRFRTYYRGLEPHRLSI